jgi:hypothetical protein
MGKKSSSSKRATSSAAPRPASPKPRPASATPAAPSARGRTAAMMRAERGSPPVHLDPQEGHLLDRALAKGQDLRDTLEDAVVAYGRWLLVEIFQNDTKKALDDASTNPVWMELVRRAGGPSLGVSRTILYVALRIAANDKRLSDETWRRLDVGRKQLLLPLREPPKLRLAAQHVMKFNLTQAKTKEYVTQLLTDEGKKRQVRLTHKGLVSRVRKLKDNLGGAAVLKKTVELAAKMSARERTELVREVAALKAILEAVSNAVERT